MIEHARNVASVSVSRSGPHPDSESDEDGISTVYEVDEDCRSQTIDLPVIDASNTATTIVTMTNSSHVQIKPVTKITGPVTIHQYPNTNSSVASANHSGVLNNRTASSNDKAELPEESGPRVTLKTSRRKFCHAMVSSLSWKAGVICTLIVALVVVVVISCFTVPRQESEEQATRPIQLPELNAEEPGSDLGEDIHIITKKRWGGYEIPDTFKNRTLAHPVPLVIVGHTASNPCETVETCSSKLQAIQSYHIAKGHPDITYNFLVGGDGNIYQGLGWDVRNGLYNNSIWISFMGNYVVLSANERQKRGVQLLLHRGIELGYLAENYSLTAHSQFENTLSPGTNLLNSIKQWPHYDNRTFT